MNSKISIILANILPEAMMIKQNVKTEHERRVVIATLLLLRHNNQQIRINCQLQIQGQ